MAKTATKSKTRTAKKGTATKRVVTGSVGKTGTRGGAKAAKSTAKAGVKKTAAKKPAAKKTAAKKPAAKKAAPKRKVAAKK